MSALIQLIYISNSTVFKDEADLQALLELSRRNNKKNSLTGMLLYHNQQFFQVLEGEHDTVMATFEKIKQDSRHRACRKMALLNIDQREFSDWSMGYYKMQHEDGALIAGFNQFMLQPTPADLGADNSEAYQLLQRFKQRALAA